MQWAFIVRPRLPQHVGQSIHVHRTAEVLRPTISASQNELAPRGVGVGVVGLLDEVEGRRDERDIFALCPRRIPLDVAPAALAAIDRVADANFGDRRVGHDQLVGQVAVHGDDAISSVA